jgi:hypothetical protein
MYKRIIFLLIVTLGICFCSIAQKKNYSAIDKLMLQIPDSLTSTTQGIASYINTNFTGQNDRSRAIFIWIAKNISYDYNNMFALNFYENTFNKVNTVLKTRKGICMHFAELFCDIANKTGINSYEIYGYTKQNDFVDYLPHAWCAAKIDTSWYIFDPTFGSGYIENSKFVKEVNNNFFKASPEKMIKSHMPFDPLWQFTYYPVTVKEFYDGKDSKKTADRYFNFNDTLASYEKQPKLEQLVSSNRRIEKNGTKNSIVFEWLQHNKREIEYCKSQIEYNKKKALSDQINSAGNSYNAGVNLMNIFINYMNSQFTPVKPDSVIKQMIDTVESCYTKAREQLSNITNTDSATTVMITNINNLINTADSNLKEQKAFVEKYIGTAVKNRKSLFYNKTKM